MIYRELGKTGIKVSEVGLGCEHLQGKPYDVVRSVVDAALEQGINILDVFMSEPEVRSNLGRALKGRRDQVVIQGHIGAAWIDGQYRPKCDPDQCRGFFEDLLTRLQTDYIDIGMLHFIDTEEDFTRAFHTPMIEYAKELKASGVIRAIGMSSHNPVVARRAVETGLIDVLMFSINAAYDIMPEQSTIEELVESRSYQRDGLCGSNPERDRLYRTCEAAGTGITVMKTYACGALLDARTSPFGQALTPAQCIHYALTRPAVASALIGCRTAEEVRLAAAYETTPGAERDYSLVLSQTPKYSLRGKCMYCNHCLPCPSLIDIAQVNKYLDLALLEDAVPATVREHYLGLANTASACISCGSCEEACPFDVPVRERMELAKRTFGR